MITPTHIAETVLYVDDLDRAARFYTTLFGCEVRRRDDRWCALRINDDQVLLRFHRDASSVLVNGERTVRGSCS